MKKIKLREIDGDKIRVQYFTWLILIFIWCAFFVPYCMLVFSLQMGDFDLSEWLSGLIISLEVCIGFSIPFVILSILNRNFFGKIVCVLDKDGIHYKDGIIKWNDVVKIEYEIEFPGGASQEKIRRWCHAIVYTKKENIVLFHAPLFLLPKLRKYDPDIKVSVSKNSKWMVVFFILVLVIIVPFVRYFK